MGLPRAVAELLATQTAFGAARLFLESGEHPGRLKDRVASPAGTTMARLHKLGTGKAESRSDVGGRRSRKRSRELGAPA